jgi:hypothetical protein
MTTSPSGPDAWALFAAAEGTGRAQEAVRCLPPSEPQPGRTAEPGWRAGAAAPLHRRRPPGGHECRQPRRAGLVGRPAGRPPNRLRLPILRARMAVGGRLEGHRALAHPSATPATNWKELP